MSTVRKIVQYTLEGERVTSYNSIREAQKIYGITHISSVCRKKRTSDGGYLWYYAEEEPGVGGKEEALGLAKNRR